MGFREIKNRARRDLHARMLVPAFYFGPLDGKSARPINVRVHTKVEALGDVKGTSFGYATSLEAIPKLLFMLDEIQPQKHAVVVVSRTEGYRLEVNEPIDGLSVTWKVRVLTAGDLAGYPSPDEGLPVTGASSLPRPNSQPAPQILPSARSAGLLSLTLPASGTSVLSLPISL